MIFGALAAMGAGLHVAAYALEGRAKLGATGTVLSVAIPVALYVTKFFTLYSVLMRTGDPLHLGLLAGTGAIVVLAVALAAAEVAVPACLAVLALVPVVTIVGYETLGHRHLAEALERL